MTQVISWWKYRTLWDRLRRVRTFYYTVPEEGITIGYQIRKHGVLWVVDIKHEKVLDHK